MKKKSNRKVAVPPVTGLYKNIVTLIEQSQKKVVTVVNNEITMLYWRIGKLISQDVLKNKRADYGEQIVATVSQQLTRVYGQGYTKSSISRMLKFYRAFPNERIVATVSQQLSWSHFVELIAVNDPLKKNFYLQLAIKESWGIRELRQRIESMLYERTSISKKPDKLIRQELKLLKTNGSITPDLVFRDPYILDFLGLKDTYSENDLESAILNSLQKFIIELGSDFAFIARQKKIMIDNEDFRIDLLFFHRGLKRLVVIDLKLDRFKAAYKGQMELYLKWLDKHERKPGEGAPLGLILCSEKQREQIELLELNSGHIRVAEYLTQLPSKNLLGRKLKTAISQARKRTGK